MFYCRLAALYHILFLKVKDQKNYKLLLKIENMHNGYDNTWCCLALLFVGKGGNCFMV